MLLRRVAIQNVKSFLEKTELILDDQMTIIIGPNGGGKTNLLDTIMFVLRRYIFVSKEVVHAPIAEQENRYEIRNIQDRQNLERHTDGGALVQEVEIEVEVTKTDLENMHSMQADADNLTFLVNKKYHNFNMDYVKEWKLDGIDKGTRFIYRLVNNNFRMDEGNEKSFLQYLQHFELIEKFRDEYDLSLLTTPLLYLPVNRSAQGFQSNVELIGFDYSSVKRQNDLANSKSQTSIIPLAIGRLAQKYRLLLEKDKGCAQKEFYDDPNLQKLTKLLNELGYEWSLETINPMKNQYDVRLKKQGTSFLVGAASSGERELLIYLFAIYMLNVRDALIVVDEPELHLHPKWQKTLLKLFIDLSQSTGNQFVFATHSPTFVSPASIQYISRVFSENQRSRIFRLNTMGLPDQKHIFNIINSQNNERIFFADEVVLVEGLSDQIFFEAILKSYEHIVSSKLVIEVVSVSGKGLFDAYQKILDACKIRYSIIADLDYIEQVGTPGIKNLLKIDTKKIKKDVIDNSTSLDGDALVGAIDFALENGSWHHASRIWEYIKSKRRQLRKDMSLEEREKISAFIMSKRDQCCFILQKGALESYLPTGYSSKDLNKLIQLLEQENFLHQLPSDGVDEIKQIFRTILQISL